MKKFMLFIILGLSANLCFAQLTVTNLTGVNIDIGASFTPESDPLCGGPTSATSGMQYLVPHTMTVNFSYPFLYETYRVGCYKSVDPATNGYIQTECFMGSQVTCYEEGDFTFIWTDCETLTIY